MTRVWLDAILGPELVSPRRLVAAIWPFSCSRLTSDFRLRLPILSPSRRLAVSPSRLAMAVVEVRDLSKRFDGVAAVDGIDLASADGEFLVLLGPSGCGKTTLLRMIGGLEPPTSGDVLIGGRVVTALPPRARQIAMVFQSYALYPHMTVSTTLPFRSRRPGCPKPSRRGG